MILQMACCDVEVTEIGYSVREVTCLFPGGHRIYFKQCHFLFNYRCFCGKKMATVCKKEYVITIKDVLCCIRR